MWQSLLSISFGIINRPKNILKHPWRNEYYHLVPAFCFVFRKFARMNPSGQKTSFVTYVGDSQMISRIQLPENKNEENILRVDKACDSQRYKATRNFDRSPNLAPCAGQTR